MYRRSYVLWSPVIAKSIPCNGSKTTKSQRQVKNTKRTARTHKRMRVKTRTTYKLDTGRGRKNCTPGLSVLPGKNGRGFGGGPEKRLPAVHQHQNLHRGGHRGRDKQTKTKSTRWSRVLSWWCYCCRLLSLVSLLLFSHKSVTIV